MSEIADAEEIGGMLGNTLREIGIPPCPSVLNRINIEMRKDEPNFKELSAIIGSDVALAAGLISLANSPYFGLRNRVRSVNDALMMLGLRVSSKAIAGLSLHKLFPSSPLLTRFWDASSGNARLSSWLAQHLQNSGVSSDDAYTFGLFRDCGIAVLITRFPEYPALLKRANEETELSFTAVEETLLPTNHAVVGCLLSQGWWLPEEICLAIRHHHEFPPQGQQNPTAMTLIALAQVAEHLFQHHTGQNSTREWEKARSFCLDQLQLSEQGITDLYKPSAEIALGDDF